jgi:hypothetical protein
MGLYCKIWLTFGMYLVWILVKERLSCLRCFVVFSVPAGEFRGSALKYATTPTFHIPPGSPFTVILPESHLMLHNLRTWYSFVGNWNVNPYKKSVIRMWHLCSLYLCERTILGEEASVKETRKWLFIFWVLLNISTYVWHFSAIFRVIQFVVINHAEI